MIKKYNIFDIGGAIVKDDAYCLVKENKSLSSFWISSVVLYRNKSTKRFIDRSNDTLLLFVDGKGVFDQLHELTYITTSDIILVPKNTEYKIINTGDVNLRFLIIKEKV